MSDFELRIDSIAAGGDGIGRRDRMVVFVPRSAPGDIARVTAVQRDRLMRGRIKTLLTPGPDRVEPPCEHYTNDRCGGCQIQHLAYRAQLDAKATIIADALNRIGRLQVERPDVEASGRSFRYRRKLTLAIRRRGGEWIAGLRRFDDPDSVFPLRDCPITEEAVVSDWRAVMAQSSMLPRSHELRGAVRSMDDGFSFSLEGGEQWREGDAFFAAIPRLRELWWTPAGQSRRLLHSRGDAAAGASFVQVNPEVATRLREWVLRLATTVAPRTAVDAYAGTGDLAVALAGRGTRVVAIEIDRDAARICASRLPEGSRAIAGPVERSIAGALPADLVIVNPPRGGLEESVAVALRDASPSGRIIYISCNPATLARDIRRMERYRVASLRGFDMFPQTAHVETVCELEAA